METLSVFEASRNAVMISLQDLWVRFFGFLPVLIGAILVLIIGWLVAVAVGNLVTRVLKVAKLNDVFDKISGLRSSLQKAGMELNAALFVGAVVKWFIIIVTLMATSDILGLAGVTLFLNQIIAYLPNVVVAAVMVIAGILFANFVQKITRASAETAKLPHSSAAAAVVKWAVLVFTFIATLVQLGIAEVLLQTLFTGFVAMLAIAGGISFGLGGKNSAEKVLKHMENDVNQMKD
jgi:hypothetical protein